jgi:hypothetical protein
MSSIFSRTALVSGAGVMNVYLQEIFGTFLQCTYLTMLALPHVFVYVDADA